MNRIKVLLIPGRLKFKDFETIVKQSNNNVKIEVLINHKKQLSEWGKYKNSNRIWYIIEPEFHKRNYENTPYHMHYDEILNKLLSDPRSFYLMERIYSVGGLKNVFNHTVIFERLIWNSLALLHQINPNIIVLPTTPHSHTWYFVKVAESIGIDVYITPTCPLRWKSWVVKGIDEQIPQEIKNKFQDGENNYRNEVIEYIDKIKSSYDNAVPEYEKERINSYRGNINSFRGELSNIINSNSIKRMFIKTRSAFYKRPFLNQYNKIAKYYKSPENYVVLFLHYQPERTTLPEGGIYVQQWLAIRAISAALPEGWYLVVKEHPSMFTNNFSKKVRDHLFYESINSLANVLLSPLDITSFELIDKSKAVATVTGTVGIEALIRNKPVIVFGAAQYRDFIGVFYIATSHQVKDVINKIKDADYEIKDEQIMNYLNWVDKNSFNKDKQNISIKALLYSIQLGVK